MKKILLVFGTRPEAIKMAPLVIELQKHQENFKTLVCVTAQHREMLDQVLSLFKIDPDYDLNIMKTEQDLYDITSRILTGLRKIFQETKPDLVLVHGDTTTSTVAALAAFYQKISVGHVEAGLRTNNIYSPWPEEINRQITSRIAKYHFAPTKFSKNNLLAENINENNIFITGNTVIDALLWVNNKINVNQELQSKIIDNLQDCGLPKEKINDWQKNNRKLILITGHRRENFGNGFINICEALLHLSQLFQDVDFVYPMHLNPNVRNAIHKIFGDITNNRYSSNSYFIEPLDYLPFVFLMNSSYLVLTDSGGIQEEAPGIGKPVLVMRDTTERPEALQAGTVRLVGTSKIDIIKEVSKLILDQNEYRIMSKANNPYGNGKASESIVNVLKSINSL